MEVSRPNFGLSYDGEAELITAVLQDYKTQKVLRVVRMNRDSLLQTLLENRVAYFSPSKQEMRVYGEVTGDYISVVDARLDEDGKSILIFVNPVSSGERGLASPRTHFSQPFFIEGGMEEDSEKRKNWVVKWVDWKMHPSLA